MGGRGSGFVAQGGANRPYGYSSPRGSGLNVASPTSQLSQDLPTERDNETFKNIKHKYNIQVMRSTDSIEEAFLIKQMNAVANVLDNIHKEYNISHRHVIGGSRKKSTTIHARMGSRNILAETSVSKPIKIIYNKHHYDGSEAEKRVSEQEQRSIDNHFSVYVPKSKMSVATTVHELAHAVQIAMFNQKTKDKGKYGDFIKYANGMRADVAKITRNKYKSNINSLSRYSATNAAEWFAETFTSLQLNGPVSPLTKALDDYLKGDR